MEERKDLFVKLLGDETGQPPMSVETMQWMSGIGCLNFFAGPAVDQVKWQEDPHRRLRADHRPS